MKLITSATEFNLEFKRLMNNYDHYLWAVAWADFDFEISELLHQKSKRILKIIVGLKFYGTSTNFLTSFYNHIGVRFSQQYPGTFHPKIYLFKNKNEWEIIIGSGNFTNSAFSLNTEASVLISSRDQGSKNIYIQAIDFINSQWKQGEIITEDFVKEYKKNKLKITLPKSPKMPKKGIRRPVFETSWNQYLLKLKKEDYQQRLELLYWVKNKLRSNQFHKLDLKTRKSIAGFGLGEPNVVIGCFGTTTARGYFKSTVIKKPEIISKAIEQIPKRGPITKEDYLNFIKYFRKVSKHEELACATRILCLLRPDYFVNVNGKNEGALGKELQVNPNKIDYYSYWNLVIELFINSDWGKQKLKMSNVDKEIYNNRVALLDCIYYQWS